MEEINAAGFDVCLVGLGTAKTALKYTHHLNFGGQITVDPSLATYKAMGWDTSAGLHTAKTSKEASERLKACASCPDSTLFLIGGGITSASQNGGLVAVSSDGKRIPYFYRQSEAGDLPDVDKLVAALKA